MSARDLANGMTSIGSRFARAVNRTFTRSGAVLDDRFHARVLRTREVRNALAYVLLNARRHAAKRGHRIDPQGRVDPALIRRLVDIGAIDCAMHAAAFWR